LCSTIVNNFIFYEVLFIHLFIFDKHKISVQTLNLTGASSISLPTSNTSLTSQSLLFSSGSLQGANFVTNALVFDQVSPKVLNACLQISSTGIWKAGTVQLGDNGTFVIGGNASLSVS
jgi:hypothetical protein